MQWQFVVTFEYSFIAFPPTICRFSGEREGSTYRKKQNLVIIIVGQ